MRKVNLAVVGATGAVGEKILEVLAERDFPIDNLYLMASARSAGKTIDFRGKIYVIEELTENSFDKDIDIALFSAGGASSLKFAPIAAQKGVIVIDNSSAWRMDPNVPLPVPEVNAEAIKDHKNIIANPNCSTIQSVVPLKPIYDAFGIERVVYSTYQAVSGAGLMGVRDLQNGTTEKFEYPINKNCIPHIDVFEDNGYTKEEIKMIDETRKILGDPDMRITATCVRVPILNSHAVSINVETKKPFTMEEVYAAFEAQEGLVVVDNPAKNEFPIQQMTDGKDEVYIGRIRRDESVENGINFWCVADNIRKGAATNTVQIAEVVAKSL